MRKEYLCILVCSIIIKSCLLISTYRPSQLLQQEIKRNVPRNCSDISIVDDDTGMVYISTELRNHSTYSIELETETATDAKIMVRVIAT